MSAVNLSEVRFQTGKTIRIFDGDALNTRGTLEFRDGQVPPYIVEVIFRGRQLEGEEAQRAETAFESPVDAITALFDDASAAGLVVKAIGNVIQQQHGMLQEAKTLGLGL